MACCYILFSKKLNRFYTGASTNVEVRIEKHNLHSYGRNRFTSTTSDWELFLEIPCEHFSIARQFELHIKRMKSSIYIRNLKQYPEIIDNLRYKFNCKQ